MNSVRMYLLENQANQNRKSSLKVLVRMQKVSA